jgi:hypothetical protein
VERVPLRIPEVGPDLLLERQSGRVGVHRHARAVVPQVVQLRPNDTPRRAIVIECAQGHCEELPLLLVVQDPVKVLVVGEIWQQDVGMLEPGSEVDLPLEPLGTEGGGQLGEKNLEGNRAVMPDVIGEIDDGHAATTELALDGVATAKCVAQAVRHAHRVSAAVETGRSGMVVWGRRVSKRRGDRNASNAATPVLPAP